MRCFNPNLDTTADPCALIGGPVSPPQTAPVADAGFDDEHKPAGWILRYCGLAKAFYYAEPGHPLCHYCGGRCGAE